MQQQDSTLTACIVNSTMVARGQVSGVAICVEAQFVDHLDIAKAVAIEAFTRTAELAKAYQTKAGESLLAMHARVQGESLHVRGEVWQGCQLKASDALVACIPLEAVVQTYKGKLRDGSIVVKGKTQVSRAKTSAWNNVKLDASKGLSKGIQRCNSWGKAPAAGSFAKLVPPVSAPDMQIYRGKVFRFANSCIPHVVSSAKSHCQRAVDVMLTKATDVYMNSSMATLPTIDEEEDKTLSARAGEGKVLTMGAGGLIGAGAGAVTGFTTGTVGGMACGLPFAIFTCGLSVPIGAVIGCSAGTGFGTLAGAAVGIMSGGLAGLEPEENAKISQRLFDKVHTCREYVPRFASSERYCDGI